MTIVSQACRHQVYGNEVQRLTVPLRVQQACRGNVPCSALNSTTLKKSTAMVPHHRIGQAHDRRTFARRNSSSPMVSDGGIDESRDWRSVLVPLDWHSAKALTSSLFVGSTCARRLGN